MGIFYDKGNQGRMSERVYLPISAFKKTFGGGTKFDLLAVRPDVGAEGIISEEKIIALLKPSICCVAF